MSNAVTGTAVLCYSSVTLTGTTSILWHNTGVSVTMLLIPWTQMAVGPISE